MQGVTTLGELFDKHANVPPVKPGGQVAKPVQAKPPIPAAAKPVGKSPTEVAKPATLTSAQPAQPAQPVKMGGEMTPKKIAVAMALICQRLLGKLKEAHQKIARLESHTGELENLTERTRFEQKVAAYVDNLVNVGALDLEDRDDTINRVREKLADMSEVPDPDFLLTEVGKMATILGTAGDRQDQDPVVPGLDKIASFQEGSPSQAALNKFVNDMLSNW